MKVNKNARVGHIPYFPILFCSFFYTHVRVKFLAGHFSKLLCVNLTLPSVCVTFRKCEKNVRNLRKCESIANRSLFYLRGSHIFSPRPEGEGRRVPGLRRLAACRSI
jgi:hypothetical protein